MVYFKREECFSEVRVIIAPVILNVFMGPALVLLLGFRAPAREGRFGITHLCNCITSTIVFIIHSCMTACIVRSSPNSKSKP